MSELKESTLFPHESAPYQELSELLGDKGAIALSSRSEKLELPDELKDVLIQAVSILENGEAVAVMPRKTLLTTQEAAEVLSVSRPTLIKYLEQEKIPYELRGRHRRIALRDVIDFQKGARADRRALLDELAEDSEQYRPRYDEGFFRTR